MLVLLLQLADVDFDQEIGKNTCNIHRDEEEDQVVAESGGEIVAGRPAAACNEGLCGLCVFVVVVGQIDLAGRE